MDPCELRLAKGDVAVRDLVARREPLVAFVLSSTLAKYDLNLAEGRVAALRATAPLVARIKDRALGNQYVRKLAGNLGVEVEEVSRAVSSAARRSGNPDPAAVPIQRSAVPDANDPRSLVEREALKLALQEPALAGPLFDSVDETAYVHPIHVVVRQAIAAAGGAATAAGGASWIEAVREECTDLAAAAVVGELAVEPLRLDGAVDPSYVGIQLSRLQLFALNRRIADVKSKLQRVNPVASPDEYRQLFGDLVSLEQHARALRDQTSGGL
jgi:DNA primase